jgi:NAD(P)-dependent dehydrogenase (short-subunit alcohol dehydrogenase family)
VVADLNRPAGPKVAKAIGADGGRPFSRTDVSGPASARAMADLAAGRFGGIDYPVNNAAIYGTLKLDLLLTVDGDYYKRFLGVNMDGALASAARSRAGGSIRVNAIAPGPTDTAATRTAVRIRRPAW